MDIRRWLAKPLIAENDETCRQMLNDLICRIRNGLAVAQQELYRNGYTQGFAEGELAGRRAAADDVNDWVSGRRDGTMLAEDAERLRRLN